MKPPLHAYQRIVALGGGHGLGRLLSALQGVGTRLTGIVTTTATDGDTIWVSGEFDRWVRFAAPKLPARYEDLENGITIDVVEDFGP